MSWRSGVRRPRGRWVSRLALSLSLVIPARASDPLVLPCAFAAETCSEGVAALLLVLQYGCHGVVAIILMLTARAGPRVTTAVLALLTTMQGNIATPPVTRWDAVVNLAALLL